MKEIQEIGFIEKSTGLNCEHRSEASVNDTRYKMCPDYSYCIDANYWKGTTFEQYLKSVGDS